MFRAHVFMFALLLCPRLAHGEVTIIQWINLFVNTLRAFFLYWYEGHSHYSMYNFDTIMDNLVVVIRDYMPESQEIENVEKANILMHGYVCLAEGKVRDLKSLEKVGTIEYKWEEDGSVKINTYFTLRHFAVSYGFFFMDFMGIKKRGSMEFDFRRNRLKVGMRIAPVFDWWSGAVRCIFSITKLEVTDLSDIKVSVDSDGWSQGDVTAQSVTRGLREHNEFLVTALRTNLLRTIYDNLSRDNPIICTDPKLDWVADRLRIMVDPKFTERFDRRCGKSRDDPRSKGRYHPPHLRRRGRNKG